MSGKTTVIILISVTIYMFICAIFYFITPFMVTWGSIKPWYLQIIIFAQDFPFDLIRRDGKIVMSLIFINALFWTLCLAGAFWLIVMLRPGRIFSHQWHNR